jgi:hypothetical protein
VLQDQRPQWTQGLIEQVSLLTVILGQARLYERQGGDGSMNYLNIF